MDLSAIQAADDAVKKIVKDHKPFAELSAALDLTRKLINSIGNLNEEKAKLTTAVAQLWQNHRAAEATAAKARAAERAEYETAMQNLNVVRNETVELQAQARQAQIAIDGYKSEMGRVAKIFGKGFPAADD